MTRSTWISLDDAAALIPNEVTVTVSSSPGLGCLDAMLRAIGDRFRATGEPRGLSMIQGVLTKVSPDLRQMDERLFPPELMGLNLRQVDDDARRVLPRADQERSGVDGRS